MAADYEKIRDENIARYGWDTAVLDLLGQLYSERTHFIFELIQNAEDAGATELTFELFADRLEVRHDGRPFTEADVRGVCGSFRVIGGDVAIKIDVEGGELDVLRGCECTIRHASHCVLTLEVHPRVYSRTGVSPAACMTFLESIRPFRFFVTETGRWVNAKDDIIDSARVLNVLAVTP